MDLVGNIQKWAIPLIENEKKLILSKEIIQMWNSNTIARIEALLRVGCPDTPKCGSLNAKYP